MESEHFPENNQFNLITDSPRKNRSISTWLLQLEHY